MSACDRAIEYVYQYIDDELTMSRKKRIQWHLKRCGSCMDAFTFEAELKKKIASGGRTQPSEELFDSLRALLQQEQNEQDPDR
ncbi:MAG: zf-HC2 domain-containing protein [Actinomycetota bacterium]